MRTRFLLLGFAAVSAALAACGGGGGSSGGGTVPTPTSTPAATPPPIPGIGPFGSLQHFNVPQPTPASQGQTAGAFSFSFPGGLPVSGSISFPAQYAVVGAGETLALRLTSSAPSGAVPSLSVARSTQSRRPMYAKSDIVPILYIGVQFEPNIVALETPPSFSITVPSSVIVPGASYWLAAYDPTQPALGWQSAFEGPAVIQGATLIFTGGGLYDFAGGSANNTYWFALYAASSSLTPPTPAPTNPPVSFGCTNQPFDAGRRTLSSGPRPLATGDTASYGGANSTLTQTIARGQPCPEPTATAVASVNDAIAVAATTAPNGSAAWDAQSIENDAFATNTVTTTTDSILNEDSTHEFTYGNTVTDENGDTIQTRYNSPQTVDELPEGSGHSWSVSPAGTVNEILTDNTSIFRTYAADGSYQETDQLTGVRTTINERADGSGSYTIGTLGTLTVDAPSAGTITLAIGTGKITIPAWFTTPASLYSDTFADDGPQASPSWCQPAVTATNPERIVETLAITDPVLGYTENRTTTYYDSQTYGTVCMQIQDTVSEYYDYLQDTPISPGVFVSGNALPLQTNTISEFYVMNSTPTINAIARRSGAIDAIRAVQRVQRMRSLQRYLQRSAQGGRS